MQKIYEIQSSVTDIEGLKPTQRQILEYVASLADKDGNVEVSTKEIAENLRLNPSTVTRVIRKLCSNGHLIQNSSAGEKGRYTIFHHYNEKTYDKPYRGPYVNNDILAAIDNLNLPRLYCRVYQAVAIHVNKTCDGRNDGRNIVFPSFETIKRNSGYSTTKSVKHAINWLVDNDFMIPVNVPHPRTKAQIPGYSISLWNSATKQFMKLSETQKKAIEALRGLEQEQEQQEMEEISDITEPVTAPHEDTRENTLATHQPETKTSHLEDATIIAKTVTTKDGERITLASLNDGNTSFIENTTIRTQPGVILTPVLIAVSKEKTQPQKPKTPIRTFDKNGKMTYAAFLQAMDTRDNCKKRQQQAQELLETDLPEDERIKTQSSIRMLQARIKVAQQSIEKYEKEQKEKSEQTPEEQPKKKEHWSYIDGKWQKHTHEHLQDMPYVKTDRPVSLGRYRLDKELKSEQTAKEGTSNDE